MISKNGEQTITFIEVTFRERKADFESRLSSFLINEEITEQERKHQSSVVVHCLDFVLTFCFFCRHFDTLEKTRQPVSYHSNKHGEYLA